MKKLMLVVVALLLLVAPGTALAKSHHPMKFKILRTHAPHVFGGNHLLR
jgi:hypothetical protein